jgi:hypothetical protein
MTAGAWIMMLLSVGGMTGMLVWCVWRVVSKPGSEGRLHAQPDIRSPDQDR